MQDRKRPNDRPSADKGHVQGRSVAGIIFDADIGLCGNRVRLTVSGASSHTFRRTRTCIRDMRPCIVTDMCQISRFRIFPIACGETSGGDVKAFLRHTSTGIPEIDVFGSIPGVQKHIQRFLGMIDRAEKTCSALFR